MAEKQANNKSSKEIIINYSLNFMIIISFLITFASIYKASQWNGKTFPGFLLYNPVIVSDVALSHWAQHQGYDLQSYDKILAVDGQEVNNSNQVYQIVSSLPAGTRIEYKIQRNNQVFNSTVPSLTFTQQDLINIFGVELFVGLVFLILGTVVFRLKPFLLTSRVFLGICLCLGIWFIIDFEYQTTYSFIYFINWQFLAQLLTPAFLILFAFVFPSPYEIYEKRKIIFLIPFLLSIVYFGTQLYLLFNQINGYWSLVYLFSYVYVFIGTIFVLSSLIFRYFKPFTSLDKQRARVVLLGALFGFLIPAFLSIFIVLLNLSNLHYLVLPILFFPLSIALIAYFP